MAKKATKEAPLTAIAAEGPASPTAAAETEAHGKTADDDREVEAFKVNFAQ